MKAARWPAIVAIVVLLVAAFLVADDDPSAEPGTTVPQAVAGAVLAKADALSSLWFCNGGTSVNDGVADHRVHVINTTGESRTGTITTYGSKPDNGTRPAPVRKPWTLAPYARAEYRLADEIGQVAYASATVEVAGGGVLVEHRIAGPLGSDRGPCATSASNAWYVPVGTTSTPPTASQPPVTRELLVFFNPFPGDAVVDATFSTDDGQRREPGAFKGLVVPGGSVVGVDLASAGVAVTNEVAAAITTRSGRVVVDRVQVFDDGANRKGIAISSGLGAAAPEWVFPVGRFAAGRQERVVVYNPNATTAEVDVELRPDDDENRAIEPFQLSVPSGQYSLLDLQAEKRLDALVTAGVEYSLVVRSADGSSVVVERLVLVAPGSPGAGVALSTGAAVAATRLVADIGDADHASSALVLVNPNVTTIAQVRLSVIAQGSLRAVPALASVELEPGARRSIPLSELGTGTFTVVIEATAPVIAERDLVTAGPGAPDRALAVAVPDSSAIAPFDLGGLDAPGN